MTLERDEPHRFQVAGQAEGGAEATRNALVTAGMRQFGSKGFDAASIRDIAAEAGANIAAIGYHFGGKEGLRRACAEQVARAIRAIASRVLGDRLDAPDIRTPDQARAALRSFVSNAIPFLLTDSRTRIMVPFMLREVMNRSVAFDIVYAGVIEPTHRQLCRLWGLATGRDAQSDEVRLAVFAMIGQVLYFRIGQEIVIKRMDWQAYGPEEARAVAAVILANLELVLGGATISEQNSGNRP
jgi:TetR/AcrR family transcriptional regulator, regulator of cefoperazone and chloramphenicol sensitivity